MADLTREQRIDRIRRIQSMKQQRAQSRRAQHSEDLADWDRQMMEQTAALPARNVDLTPTPLGKAKYVTEQLLKNTGKEIDAVKEGAQEFGKGATRSVFKTAVGIQNLLKDKGLPYSAGRLERDKEILERADQWAEGAGGSGKAGEIAGDIAQLAVPGGAGARFGKFAGFGTDVAAGTGMAAARAEEGERLDAVKEELQNIATGAVAGKVLEKTIKGITKTPEAEKLLDMGIPLTPGQASSSGLPRVMDFLTKYTLFGRKGQEVLEQNVDKAFNKVALNRAAPPGKEITEIGVQGADQLKKAFNDAYDEAWSGVKSISNAGRVNIVNQMQNTFRQFGDASRPALVKISDSFQDATRNFTPEKVRNLDKEIRRQIEAAATGATPNPMLADELVKLRNTLRDSVGTDISAKLKPIDAKYPEFLSVRGAATGANALKNRQVFNVDELIQGAGQAAGESRRFGSTAPMFDLTDPASVTMGRKDPGFLASTRQALAANVPSPTALLELRRRAALGDSQAQKDLQPIIEALRASGVSGATVGAAVGEEQ